MIDPLRNVQSVQQKYSFLTFTKFTAEEKLLHVYWLYIPLVTGTSLVFGISLIYPDMKHKTFGRVRAYTHRNLQLLVENGHDRLTMNE